MSRLLGNKTDIEPLEFWEYELIMAKLPEHWRYFYQILWETGIRVTEGLEILKPDITGGGVWINREKRKDKLREHLPLTPELYRSLLAYIFYLRGNKVFPYTASGAWLALREACAKAGVRTTLHPHSFRHGFGYRAMKADLGAKNALEQLRIVQRMMGHVRISSTERYTQSTKEDVTNAFKIINK